MTVNDLWRILGCQEVPSDATVLIDDGEGHYVEVKSVTVTTEATMSESGSIVMKSKILCE